MKGADGIEGGWRWSSVRRAREIGGIIIKRLVDRCRPAGVGIVTAGQLLGLVASLPEIQHAGAIGVLVIVGERERT